MAATVDRGRKDLVLLTHNSIVIGGGPVGRSDDGRVTVAGDVVGTHEFTAGDAVIGRHGRGMQKRLGAIKRADARSAAHAAVVNGAVRKAKLYGTSVKTCFRFTVWVIMEDAVCEEKITGYLFAQFSYISSGAYVREITEIIEVTSAFYTCG